jgi:predicted RNA methylase
LKTPEERNRLGQFATPYPLALEIAGYMKSLLKPHHPRPRFADPSIGSGSFYSAASAVFGRNGLEHATGIELDPAFAAAAESLWGRSGLHMVRGDFTRVIIGDNCPPAPSLILANPPYVRHHHMDRDEKLRLQSLVHRRTGIKVSGLSGLYLYFLILATTWMEKGGIAAWLIPSEFMDVNYGAALRDFLSKHARSSASTASIPPKSSSTTPSSPPPSSSSKTLPHRPVTVPSSPSAAPSKTPLSAKKSTCPNSAEPQNGRASPSMPTTTAPVLTNPKAPASGTSSASSAASPPAATRSL